MEEERREVYQEQQETEVPAEAAPEPQRRGGFSGVVSFFLGLIIGAFVMFAITYATWKIPLDSANEQVKALEAQVQAANQRADKMRDALTRAQEALNALNEALQEISPPGKDTSKPQRAAGSKHLLLSDRGTLKCRLQFFITCVPNCGERVSADRLEAGLACSKCLPIEAVRKGNGSPTTAFMRLAPRKGQFAKLQVGLLPPR
jgi:cell division protein FtsL